MARKKLTFEEALQQIEELTAEIEQGKIGLESSIDKYEEGVGLIRRCREMLHQAELRIQRVNEQEDGSLTASEDATLLPAAEEHGEEETGEDSEV
jgi:exodeoxyribonuclease VII small subunit